MIHSTLQIGKIYLSYLTPFMRLLVVVGLLRDRLIRGLEFPVLPQGRLAIRMLHHSQHSGQSTRALLGLLCHLYGLVDHSLLGSLPCEASVSGEREQ